MGPPPCMQFRRSTIGFRRVKIRMQAIELLTPVLTISPGFARFVVFAVSAVLMFCCLRGCSNYYPSKKSIGGNNLSVPRSGIGGGVLAQLVTEAEQENNNNKENKQYSKMWVSVPVSDSGLGPRFRACVFVVLCVWSCCFCCLCFLQFLLILLFLFLCCFCFKYCF